MAMPRDQRHSRWQLQFVLTAAIWGSSFVFIKVLGRHWSAVWVAFGRVSVGAITLAVLVLARRERFPADRRLWLHCLVAAVLFNAAPFTLFAFGEQHTSSIVAGLWNATTPLWVMIVLLAAFPEERPTRGRITGISVGFVGAIVLLGPWRGLPSGALIGQLACAGAAACYGLGFPYTRRYLAGRKESGVVLSACQLTAAVLVLAPFLALSRSPTTDIGFDGWGSLLALGALGSGVAYALNYAVVRARGSAVASTVTYLIPVFSTVLGVAVLGETLRWNQPVGALVLLFGIAVSEGRLTGRYSRGLRPGQAQSSASALAGAPPSGAPSPRSSSP
jgi:drug/metabolite transporter (DMT)-like permease